VKRHIIRIDETLCNGCGQCIPGCPEGALQVIDGKARLVSDLFCDGLGACIGECPQGAITVEQRDAQPYNERLVMENIVRMGPGTIGAHLEHLRHHGEEAYLNEALDFLRERGHPVPEDLGPAASAHHHGHAGCPGSMAVDLSRPDATRAEAPVSDMPSELSQWPVQLHLVNPASAHFHGAHLLVTADCVPFSLADFHGRFLKGKKLIVFCPKLDRADGPYIEKLLEILSTQDIQSVSVVHMEVPCCFGAVQIVKEALRRSGREIPFLEHTVSIRGSVL
jgi:ferredoxin